MPSTSWDLNILIRDHIWFRKLIDLYNTILQKMKNNKFCNTKRLLNQIFSYCCDNSFFGHILYIVNKLHTNLLRRITVCHCIEDSVNEIWKFLSFAEKKNAFEKSIGIGKHYLDITAPLKYHDWLRVIRSTMSLDLNAITCDSLLHACAMVDVYWWT